jgi:aminoglycoside phosphotransferase (APT) family kinase protein
VRKSGLTSELVCRLIAEQFPQWAHLPVRPVELDGWDNASFRLGDDMSVRLPSDEAYAAAVDKEHRWLPVLADQLPLPIPRPLGKGRPGCGFPRSWSVYQWLPGQPAMFDRIDDLRQFATDLAGFLRALYRIDPAGGPPGGEHNFWRGGPLTVYDAATRRSIETLADEFDPARTSAVWEAALAAPWNGRVVWVHGDVAPGNLLTENGRLSAVIDFGTSAVGDPACDTAMAWTFFAGDSQDTFKAGLGFDPGTFARGRGWALWKSMLVLIGAREDDPEDAAYTRNVIQEILADHERSSSAANSTVGP